MKGKREISNKTEFCNGVEEIVVYRKKRKLDP